MVIKYVDKEPVSPLSGYYSVSIGGIIKHVKELSSLSRKAGNWVEFSHHPMGKRVASYRGGTISSFMFSSSSFVFSVPIGPPLSSSHL